MAFTITYDGNGSDGGAPPVDNGRYNAGDTVKVADIGTILATKSMTRRGAVLAYWNTKADGSGVPHGWPQDTTFAMPAANLTLYAQWFVTTGLTNGGATTHYAFAYDESLRASGLEPGRTQTLVAEAEGDYATMANWFKGVTPASSPINVYVTRLTGGARNTGDIRIKPNTQSPDELRSLLVSEVTESFMRAQNKGWGYLPGSDNEESCGEALSLFLTQRFALKQGFADPYTGFTTPTAIAWLNSSLPRGAPGSTRFATDGTNFDFGSRADYVNTVLPINGNGPGTGGSILFLYYLFHQLGFTTDQIIAAAPGYKTNSDGKPVLDAIAPLRGVYKNLTGDDGDPFPRFKQLLDAAYPENEVASIRGDNPDDPWPLPRPGVLTGVVTDAGTGAPIDAAILVIDGPASAGIHAEHLQLTAGSDGSYTTPPLAPGDYTVEGSAADYVPVTITVSVSDGPATIRANVALPWRLPITVQGTVTDSARALLAGVSVTLVGEPGPIWLQTSTDGTGAYRLSLDPGQYTGAYGLYAKLDGYVEGYLNLANIPNGANLTEAFVLVAFGAIVGRITEAGATPAIPIVGAGVSAGPAFAASDASGRYALEQLSPGPAVIAVAAKGFERAGPTPVSVPEGAILTQDFALVRASAALTGTISDAEYAFPISGALVSVAGATPQESKADGTYTVEKIPAGPATITIKARGYDVVEATRAFAAHETITQDFGLYKPLPPGPAT